MGMGAIQANKANSDSCEVARSTQVERALESLVVQVEQAEYIADRITDRINAVLSNEPPINKENPEKSEDSGGLCYLAERIFDAVARLRGVSQSYDALIQRIEL